MLIEKFYTYLGTNGTITSSVYLEGIYSVKKYRLTADDKKILVCGSRKEKRVMIPEADLNLWTEESV